MRVLKVNSIGAMEEAIETKVYAAEKNAASIRIAIITLNIFVYFFVMDRTGTIPWLANSTVVVAFMYGLYVLLFQPYRRFPVLLSSYFTSLSDAALITLWLLATGGIKSPFYVLWYASIVGVASRYRYRETLLAAALYAASYLGLVASLDRLTDHLTEVIVRISYIFFVGLLGGLLAQETLAQTRVKIELARLISQSLDPEKVGQRIVDSVRELFRARAVVLFRREPESEDLMVLAVSGDTGPAFGRNLVFPRGTGVAGLAVRERRPVVTLDVLTDPHVTLPPEVRAPIEQGANRAVLAVPLVVKDTVIGALGVGDRAGRVFNKEEIRLAQTFADQAALALQNVRLYEETRRLQERTALLEIAEILNSTLELKPLLKEITQRTAQVVGVDRCSIFLCQGGHMIPVMSQFADGHAEPEMWKKFKAMGRLSVDEVPALAEAVRSKRPVVVEDAAGSGLLPASWGETFGSRSALVVPLIRKEDVVGTMKLDDMSGPHAWDRAKVDLALTIASQVALAVDDASLYEDTRRQAQELALLHEVASTLTSTLDLPAVLEAIADSALPLIGAQRCAVFELDPGDQRLHARATRGMRPDQPFMPMKLGQGAAGSAALQRQPVFSPDVHHQPLPMYDEPWEKTGMLLRDVVRQRGYRAILAVPLVSKETVLGAICIYWDQVHSYDEREVRLLTALAQQAAVAIENSRLYKETRDQQHEAEILTDIGRELSSSLELEAVLQKILGYAKELCGSDMAFVAPYDPTERAATIIACLGTRTDVFKAAKILPGRGIGGKVLESGQPFVTDDYLHDPRLTSHYKPLAEQEGFVTNLAVPITREGEILGVLWVVNRTQRPFTTRDQLVLTKLANQAAIAIQNARLYEQAQKALADLKTAQDQLVQSEKFRALGEMAGGVAHDFNNVLAAILGRAQCLLLRLGEGEVASQEARRSLGVIERAALDGAETVRRLLEFTRAAPRSGEALPVDINELFAHTVEVSRHRWKDEVEARGHQIQVVIEPGDVAPVVGNPAELREVLLNLIFNAIEAMPQGGTLTLSSRVEGHMICLSLRDTGIGMLPEIRQRIFDPFFTTKGPQASGLGLSASYGIIHRHGGEITVDSREGQGTTFTIKLPIRTPPAPRVEETPAARGSQLRILVIDDEVAVRETLREILESAGHEVHEAGSGPEGLEILERERADLVCTDLGMPGMTGWEVADRIKARWPGRKVALVTGWSARVEVGELEAHGVDLLIAKPFQIKAIFRALSDLVPSHQSKGIPAARSGGGKSHRPL